MLQADIPEYFETLNLTYYMIHRYDYRQDRKQLPNAYGKLLRLHPLSTY